MDVKGGCSPQNNLENCGVVAELENSRNKIFTRGVKRGALLARRRAANLRPRKPAAKKRAAFMLARLFLKEFRCFEALTVPLSDGFNFFVGANGEGKTSILEAACVLLRLQSQRSSSLAPVVQAGAKTFSLRGALDDHALEFQYGGLRRRLRFDEVEQRTATEYLRLARVVSFANTDIEMVRGGSEPRRRYLDFVGSQIEARYRPTLRAYERALRSRNALLKSARPRARELAAYDEPLIRHGTELGLMRARMVERIAPVAAAAHAEIGGSAEKVDIFFSPGTEPDFAAHLARSRPQEERLRQTVVGPHRDDIDLFVDGMAAQNYASEGQQRTLALALKLGQARIFAEHGAPAILLIDDIFGELDPSRRNALLGTLAMGGQKLVTATSLEWRAKRDSAPTWLLRDRRLRAID
jgi:DNA replication and repair protein RecF